MGGAGGSLTRTHLHLEKRTAERGPAEQRLEEGQLRLVGGHTTLFIVGGEDALRITEMHIRFKACAREVNNRPAFGLFPRDQTWA